MVSRINAGFAGGRNRAIMVYPDLIPYNRASTRTGKLNLSIEVQKVPGGYFNVNIVKAIAAIQEGYLMECIILMSEWNQFHLPILSTYSSSCLQNVFTFLKISIRL